MGRMFGNKREQKGAITQNMAAECSEIEKTQMQKTQKIQEKSVDKGDAFGYTLIIPLRTDMILENDTESRRTRDAIFTSRIVEKTVNSYMSFELEGDFKVQYRIKHESLILAQDERWRRA